MEYTIRVRIFVFVIAVQRKIEIGKKDSRYPGTGTHGIKRPTVAGERLKSAQ